MVGEQPLLCWLHADLLGSIQAISTSTGKLSNLVAFGAQNYKGYTPFGDSLGSANADASVGYTGQREYEPGLIYLHARYYDPQLARFIAADTITPDGKIAGLNRYSYCENDPVNYSDPSGHVLVGGSDGGNSAGDSATQDSYGSDRASDRAIYTADIQATQKAISDANSHKKNGAPLPIIFIQTGITNWSDDSNSGFGTAGGGYHSRYREWRISAPWDKYGGFCYCYLAQQRWDNRGGKRRGRPGGEHPRDGHQDGV